jgi:hypothetical protein
VVDWAKFGLDIDRSDLKTWKGLLNNVVDASGGDIVPGPDTVIGGRDEPNVQQFYDRVR